MVHTVMTFNKSIVLKKSLPLLFASLAFQTIDLRVYDRKKHLFILRMSHNFEQFVKLHRKSALRTKESVTPEPD